MRFRSLAALCVVVLGVPAATAGTLKTGRLLAGNSDLAICVLSNVGTKTLTIQSARVVDDHAIDITTNNHCSDVYNLALPAGYTCTFDGTDVLDGYRCEVTFAGSARDVRLMAYSYGYFDEYPHVAIEGR